MLTDPERLDCLFSGLEVDFGGCTNVGVLSVPEIKSNSFSFGGVVDDLNFTEVVGANLNPSYVNLLDFLLLVSHLGFGLEFKHRLGCLFWLDWLLNLHLFLTLSRVWTVVKQTLDLLVLSLFCCLLQSQRLRKFLEQTQNVRFLCHLFVEPAMIQILIKSLVPKSRGFRRRHVTFNVGHDRFNVSVHQPVDHVLIEYLASDNVCYWSFDFLEVLQVGITEFNFFQNGLFLIIRQVQCFNYSVDVGPYPVNVPFMVIGR